MVSEYLPIVEYESACNMLNNILEQSINEIGLTDTIPPINDISDNNTVFKGKLSVLFVDMRKSTDLTDELKSKKMVKVYRSFIRMIVQAVRYCDGQSRQFVGDGVMGVFQDSSDDNNPETSSERAVRAGRYILTLIDYCLNPQLKKHFDDVTIGCGVGICTGTVMATKVGMRGKEADETSENEMGIVWVGSTTNYASRFCGLALPREIFIDDNTYKGIPSKNEHWKKETRVKGTKSFFGYLAKDYYLSLPDGIDIKPVFSDEVIEADTSFVQRIFDETEERTLHLVGEIGKKSAELTKKLIELDNKEKALNSRENTLANREKNINATELQKEFSVKTDFLSKAAEKLTNEQIRSLGQDYWLSLIVRVKEINNKGLDGGNSWRISQIYSALQLYNEFYDEVCNMARCGFPIWESEIRIVLDKTYYRSTLKDILKSYITQNKLGERVDEYAKLISLLEE